MSAGNKGAPPNWGAVKTLVEAQKFQEALTQAEALLKQAQAAGDEANWTKGLITVAQLRTALHGYETAVRSLKEQPWPKGTLSRIALDLYYAQALVTYLDGYSWEIRQRERVDTGTKDQLPGLPDLPDLKAMTVDQIYTAALAAYDNAWQQRAELGKQPVKALAEFVVPNTYPDGIRPTLRDAVTYMAVKLLANSSYWRPADSNAAEGLDVTTLLGNAGDAGSLRLADADVHPLRRLTAALNDLEAWHADADQDEPALEAALEKSRQLHAALSDTAQRRTLRDRLADRLKGQQSLPWWSMGMGELAEMTREAGDLVKAHALAGEGRKAHPKTVGGKRCLSLEKQIEMPSFGLTAMAVDGPSKRSVQIQYTNLSTLFFRAYPLDLMQSLKRGEDYDLLPGYDQLTRLLKDQEPAQSWKETLENPGDFAGHTAYVTPQLRRPGLYVIMASAREDFLDGLNEIQGIRFVVSNLSMVSRLRRGSGFDVTVVEGASGKPVAGAEVQLFHFDARRRQQPAAVAKTDAKGEASLARPQDPKNANQGSYFLLAKHGDDITIDATYQYLGRAERQRPTTGRASLLYTDRSVYRPGQKLLWKVVAYSGKDGEGEFRTMPKAAVTLTLHDGNGQVVAERKVESNAFGSASGEFLLPTGRLLGRWSLRSSYGGGGTEILVEEYKRPTFEVMLKDPETALRLNQQVTLTGEGRYYFGLPVAGGNVRWKVSRETVYPWWYFYWYRPDAGRSESVATGTAKVKDDGTFAVSFRPEAVEKPGQRDVSYHYRVEVDLTDEGGETRSASRAFRIGFVAVEAMIKLERGFVDAGKAQDVVIQRTSLDGTPRAGAGEFRVLALQQPTKALAPADLPEPEPPQDDASHVKLTAGDRLRPRWSNSYSVTAELSRWADGAEQTRGKLTHDNQGQAVAKLPALAPGAYRIRYTTLDEFGAKAETWQDLVVGGKDTPLALAGALLVERDTVKVGDKVRILAKTAVKGQTAFLEIFRNGELRERRRLEAGDDLIEIPVTEADRGGFGVAFATVVDHQLIYLSSTVHVPWDNKELQVDFSTFRDKLTPGAKETFRVTVRGAKAAAGAAEVLAYMYDKSLDFFAPHAVPTPLSLYPLRGNVPGLRYYVGPTSGLPLHQSGFAQPPSWEPPQPDQLKQEDGYGIGGMGNYSLSMAESSGGSMKRAMPMAAVAAPSDSAAADDANEPEGAPMVDKLSGNVVRTAAKAPADPAATPAPDGLRTNFSETAFFQPHLLTDKNGAVAFEFKVPDSVTAWNLWVVALTQDLRGGAVKRETRSVKDLMVRPYMPRFLREGDAAELKVVINNASAGDLSGDLKLEIVDPETGKSADAVFGLKDAQRQFRVKAGAGANVVFQVSAPRQVGTWAFKVTAKSGNLQDGELRPLPVLPSRVHLMQSRFVTLRDQETRTLSFDDLKKDDATRINDQLVVTVDGQLFYGVLKALPYLASYPYECTEQTLNRFLSTGIVAKVFKDNPAVASMAGKLAAARATPLDPWRSRDRNDPNVRMTLEESPWLVESQGGTAGADDELQLIKTLDPDAVQRERAAALEKLRKAQASDGGFPWFQGGPSSPYITLYLLHGFAKAAEFGVDVPKEMVVKAWRFVAAHFRKDLAPTLTKAGCCWEELTFLNYVLSAFPDPSWTAGALTAAERQTVLAHSFKHWKQHSPYLKAYLALTLKRAGRAADAQLVFDSVMDSAKTDKDLGTYWAQEDRSWLWYNDTVESHAFALRTLMELSPDDKRRDGLVQWLFLNRQLNHWKSTRATAEAIYSLVHYLKKAGTLGIKEAATVTVGKAKETFTFLPDTYEGRAQLVVPGPAVNAETATVTVDKQTKGLMFASATWHFSTETPPTEDRGDFFHVSRRYFKRDGKAAEAVLKPLAAGDRVGVGDQIEVQVSLRSKHAAEYVHLRDPRPAGFEPESTTSRYQWDLGIGWYEEVRDSGANFFFEQLPVGEYTFKYRLRAATAGTFMVGPATVQSMYAPEFTAYSAATRITAF